MVCEFLECRTHSIKVDVCILVSISNTQQIQKRWLNKILFNRNVTHERCLGHLVSLEMIHLVKTQKGWNYIPMSLIVLSTCLFKWRFLIRLSQQWLWRLLSSGMQQHILWYKFTDFSLILLPPSPRSNNLLPETAMLNALFLYPFPCQNCISKQ